MSSQNKKELGFKTIYSFYIFPMFLSYNIIKQYRTKILMKIVSLNQTCNLDTKAYF